MGNPLATIAAAIVAGGKATRYGGAAKGLLRLRGGETIIGRLVRAIRAAGISSIAICANDPTPYQDLGLPIVPDEVAGAGPLGGIAAALRHFRGEAAQGEVRDSKSRSDRPSRISTPESRPFEAVLILPCDMPGLTEREIGALIEAFRSSHPTLAVATTAADQTQPLCAILSIALLDHVLRAIEQRELAVGALWRKLGAQPVRFADAAPFANINTPQEMAAWLEADQRRSQL